MHTDAKGVAGQSLEEDKQHDSDKASSPLVDTELMPPTKVEDVESTGSSAAVDRVTEAKLLRKLDIRSMFKMPQELISLPPQKKTE